MAALMALSLSFSVAQASTRTIAMEQIPSSRGAREWTGNLDLRQLPSGTWPDALLVTVQPISSTTDPTYASIRINGALLARPEITATGATFHLQLKERQLSLQNRIVITTGNVCRTCPSDAMAGPQLGPVQVTLVKAPSAIRNFHQLASVFREGVRINASPTQAGFARRALKQLAPLAPIDAGAKNEIVVSELPPPSTEPWLRFDRGTVRLSTRNGLNLYGGSQLIRMTIVQIVRRGERYILWIKPGRDASVPASMPLDYGNVAMFRNAGPEIAFSTSDDPIIQANYERDEAESSALFRLWRSLVLVLWAVLSVGAIFTLKRVPRLEPRKG